MQTTETKTLITAQILKPFEQLLHEWHGGQRSSVYSVASLTTAGKPSDIETVLSCLNELEISLLALQFQDTAQAAVESQELLALVQTLNTAITPTLDQKYRLLCNGQGEHDVSVLASLETTHQDLRAYVAGCGGQVVKRGHRLGLITPFEGSWVFYYSTDHQTLLRVAEVTEDSDEVTPYWDPKVARVIDGFYQVGNMAEA